VKNILIVDDHPLMLEILRAVTRMIIPEAEAQLATCLAQGIEAARGMEKIDLVLLDLGLPDCFGIGALTLFRDAFPQAPVVVISAHEDRAMVVAALEAGAIGYIPKTSTPDVMMAALRLVAAGGTYVPPQVLHPPAQDTDLPERRVDLTERQLDVLRLLVKGLANKEIARQLRIAKDTVKQHAKAVYAVLGVASRSQVARVAERRGIKLD